MDTHKPEKPPLDPLRRVFVPVERRTPNGTTVFKTHDNRVYARLEDGSIRRAVRKARGKAARRRDKETRRRVVRPDEPSMHVRPAMGGDIPSGLPGAPAKAGEQHPAENTAAGVEG